MATAAATAVDHAVTADVQDRLAKRDLAPREPLVETGYVAADHLLTSEEHRDRALVGPIHEDYGWQARAGEGFGAARFAIDWERERAACPQGKTSRVWKPAHDTGGFEVVNIRSALDACRACAVRAHRVASKRERSSSIRPRAKDEALRAARRRQHTPGFRERYRARAGIEGTFSQAVALCELRRSRYRGLAKTTLVHLLIATALNPLRVAAWLAERPRAATRTSTFAALRPACA